MIVIVDCQIGNVGSILNMLRKAGAAAVISSSADDIAAADKLILPGVGAFDNGMAKLRSSGLVPLLREKVMDQGTPILGICLGMQLFTTGSEEGVLPGLGWLAARTVRFRADANRQLKVPHMGWNAVRPRDRDSLFWQLDSEAGFYFVHAYHVICERDCDVLATSHHGYEFVSSVQCGNIFGTQFHPEKSHRYGLQLLTNFAERGRC